MTAMSLANSEGIRSFDWLEDALLSVCEELFTVPSLAIQSIRTRVNRISSHKDFDFVVQSGETDIRLVLRLHHGLFSYWGGTEDLKCAKEYSAMRHAYQCGYPAPFPYCFSSSKKPFGFPYLIVDPGDGLRWWENEESLSINQDATVYSIAEQLSHLHNTVMANHPLIPTVEPENVLDQLWVRVNKLENSELNRAIQHAKAQLLHQSGLTPVFLHGCFDLDNMLLLNKTIRTVINWEHAAIGDPRWDVAYTSLSLQRKNDRFLSNRFVARYVQLSGNPINDLGFWEGLVALRGYALSQWLHSLDEKSYQAIAGPQANLFEVEDENRKTALQHFG